MPDDRQSKFYLVRHDLLDDGAARLASFMEIDEGVLGELIFPDATEDPRNLLAVILPRGDTLNGAI